MVIPLTHIYDASRSFSVRFAIVNSKVSFEKRCEDISSDDDDTCSEMSGSLFLLFRPQSLLVYRNISEIVNGQMWFYWLLLSCNCKWNEY